MFRTKLDADVATIIFIISGLRELDVDETLRFYQINVHFRKKRPFIMIKWQSRFSYFNELHASLFESVQDETDTARSSYSWQTKVS